MFMFMLEMSRKSMRNKKQLESNEEKNSFETKMQIRKERRPKIRQRKKRVYERDCWISQSYKNRTFSVEILRFLAFLFRFRECSSESLCLYLSLCQLVECERAISRLQYICGLLVYRKIRNSRSSEDSEQLTNFREKKNLKKIQKQAYWLKLYKIFNFHAPISQY